MKRFPAIYHLFAMKPETQPSLLSHEFCFETQRDFRHITLWPLVKKILIIDKGDQLGLLHSFEFRTREFRCMLPRALREKDEKFAPH